MRMIFHNTFHFSFILAQLYFNVLLKKFCNHKGMRFLILQLLDTFNTCLLPHESQIKVKNQSPWSVNF